MDNTKETVPIGRKIEKLRKLMGWKQEALALEVGLTQPQISAIENSEKVNEETLHKIANALNINPQIIKQFDEQHAFYNVDNTPTNVASSNSAFGIRQAFSPIDKVVELYQRLLASEKEKLELIKSQNRN